MRNYRRAAVAVLAVLLLAVLLVLYGAPLGGR